MEDSNELPSTNSEQAKERQLAKSVIAYLRRDYRSEFWGMLHSSTQRKLAGSDLDMRPIENPLEELESLAKQNLDPYEYRWNASTWDRRVQRAIQKKYQKSPGVIETLSPRAREFFVSALRPADRVLIWLSEFVDEKGRLPESDSTSPKEKLLLSDTRRVLRADEDGRFWNELGERERELLEESDLNTRPVHDVIGRLSTLAEEVKRPYDFDWNQTESMKRLRDAVQAEWRQEPNLLKVLPEGTVDLAISALPDPDRQVLRMNLFFQRTRRLPYNNHRQKRKLFDRPSDLSQEEEAALKSEVVQMLNKFPNAFNHFDPALQEKMSHDKQFSRVLRNKAASQTTVTTDPMQSWEIFKMSEEDFFIELSEFIVKNNGHFPGIRKTQAQWKIRQKDFSSKELQLLMRLRQVARKYQNASGLQQKLLSNLDRVDQMIVRQAIREFPEWNGLQSLKLPWTKTMNETEKFIRENGRLPVASNGKEEARIYQNLATQLKNYPALIDYYSELGLKS